MFDGWDLAVEPPPVERDFQSIHVAGRPFAVPADSVRGELGAMSPTPVPGAVSFVRGVLMWQGQVVPVLATGERLSLPVLRKRSAELPLLQLEVGGEFFFLEVDSVDAVISGGRLEPSEEPIPMVAGFIERDGDKLPVIDLDQLTDFGRKEKRT